MSPYLSVFIESLWCASIIPLGQQPTFFAMLGFGGYNIPLALAVAISASILGMLFNWSLGRAMFAFYRQGKITLPAVNYDRASRIFCRYLWFLLFLCWSPMLNYMPLIAAFLNMRLRYALPLIVASQVGYYLYYALGLHIELL